VALAVSLVLSTAASLAGQSLAWKGAEVPSDQLDALPSQARATVRAWLPFAESTGYRLVLDPAGELLLVLHAGHARKDPRHERPEVRKLVEALSQTQAAVAPLLGEAEDGLAPAVLVATVQADYRALLAQVARLDPRVKGWAEARAGQVAGFVLSEPLVAAWLDDGVGQEEWDPRNELVHRAAQLLLRRRAAQLPPWFALGFGWHVEDLVLGGIYCFPHRQGFVWATEHAGWGKRLAAAFKPSRRKAAGLPAELTMAEFGAWDPMRETGDFDVDRALIAFGAVRFVAVWHPQDFAGLARGFDAAIRSGWKVTISATEWTTDPDYQLPVEAQLEVLEAVEPGFLSAVTAAFVRDVLGPARRADRRR
jgi:hypothetical protein